MLKNKYKLLSKILVFLLIFTFILSDFVYASKNDLEIWTNDPNNPIELNYDKKADQEKIDHFFGKQGEYKKKGYLENWKNSKWESWVPFIQHSMTYQVNKAKSDKYDLPLHLPKYKVELDFPKWYKDKYPNAVDTFGIGYTFQDYNKIEQAIEDPNLPEKEREKLQRFLDSQKYNSIIPYMFDAKLFDEEQEKWTKHYLSNNLNAAEKQKLSNAQKKYGFTKKQAALLLGSEIATNKRDEMYSWANAESDVINAKQMPPGTVVTIIDETEDVSSPTFVRPFFDWQIKTRDKDLVRYQEFANKDETATEMWRGEMTPRKFKKGETRMLDFYVFDNYKMGKDNSTKNMGNLGAWWRQPQRKKMTFTVNPHIEEDQYFEIHFNKMSEGKIGEKGQRIRLSGITGNKNSTGPGLVEDIHKHILPDGKDKKVEDLWRPSQPSWMFSSLYFKVTNEEPWDDEIKITELIPTPDPEDPTSNNPGDPIEVNGNNDGECISINNDKVNTNLYRPIFTIKRMSGDNPEYKNPGVRLWIRRRAAGDNRPWEEIPASEIKSSELQLNSSNRVLKVEGDKVTYEGPAIEIAEGESIQLSTRLYSNDINPDNDKDVQCFVRGATPVDNEVIVSKVIGYEDDGTIIGEIDLSDIDGQKQCIDLGEIEATNYKAIIKAERIVNDGMKIVDPNMNFWVLNDKQNNGQGYSPKNVKRISKNNILAKKGDIIEYEIDKLTIDGEDDVLRIASKILHDDINLNNNRDEKCFYVRKKPVDNELKIINIYPYNAKDPVDPENPSTNATKLENEETAVSLNKYKNNRFSVIIRAKRIKNKGSRVVDPKINVWIENSLYGNKNYTSKIVGKNHIIKEVGDTIYYKVDNIPIEDEQHVKIRSRLLVEDMVEENNVDEKFVYKGLDPEDETITITKLIPPNPSKEVPIVDAISDACATIQKGENYDVEIMVERLVSNNDKLPAPQISVWVQTERNGPRVKKTAYLDKSYGDKLWKVGDKVRYIVKDVQTDNYLNITTKLEHEDMNLNNNMDSKCFQVDNPLDISVNDFVTTLDDDRVIPEGENCLSNVKINYTATINAPGLTKREREKGVEVYIHGMQLKRDSNGNFIPGSGQMIRSPILKRDVVKINNNGTAEISGTFTVKELCGFRPHDFIITVNGGSNKNKFGGRRYKEDIGIGDKVYENNEDFSYIQLNPDDQDICSYEEISGNKTKVKYSDVKTNTTNKKMPEKTIGWNQEFNNWWVKNRIKRVQKAGWTWPTAQEDRKEKLQSDLKSYEKSLKESEAERMNALSYENTLQNIWSGHNQNMKTAEDNKDYYNQKVSYAESQIKHYEGLISAQNQKEKPNQSLINNYQSKISSYNNDVSYYSSLATQYDNEYQQHKVLEESANANYKNAMSIRQAWDRDVSSWERKINDTNRAINSLTREIENIINDRFRYEWEYNPSEQPRIKSSTNKYGIREDLYQPMWNNALSEFGYRKKETQNFTERYKMRILYQDQRIKKEHGSRTWVDVTGRTVLLKAGQTFELRAQTNYRQNRTKLYYETNNPTIPMGYWEKNPIANERNWLNGRSSSLSNNRKWNKKSFNPRDPKELYGDYGNPDGKMKRITDTPKTAKASNINSEDGISVLYQVSQNGKVVSDNRHSANITPINKGGSSFVDRSAINNIRFNQFTSGGQHKTYKIPEWPGGNKNQSVVQTHPTWRDVEYKVKVVNNGFEGYSNQEDFNHPKFQDITVGNKGNKKICSGSPLRIVAETTIKIKSGINIDSQVIGN